MEKFLTPGMMDIEIIQLGYGEFYKHMQALQFGYTRDKDVSTLYKMFMFTIEDLR